jgi:FAD/FMN-containing dehydrogenase
MSLDAIKKIVGPKGFLDTPADLSPYLSSWRGGYQGKALLAVFPEKTAQIAEIVKCCREQGIAITPQGGNTGLVGGGVPSPASRNILLSLSRMKKVRELNPLNATIMVEAGMILSELQDYCRGKDFLFPLSMASEGSAEIGGCISTNAGGTAVLKYGTTRDLVLGLEVVLPDGTIFEGLHGLRKDNTGYDLKQLFIGAEGTLGIITAACLKLFPLPRQMETALVGLSSAEAAIELLSHMRAATGDAISAFEIISRQAVDLVLKHLPGISAPFKESHPFSVLIEVSSSMKNLPLRNILEDALAPPLEKGLIADALLAESLMQAETFWHIRESISEAEKKEGKGLHFDVSLPISAIGAFMKQAGEQIHRAFPNLLILPFGHIGDGNIHYNLCIPSGAERQDFRATKDSVKEIVYALLAQHHGSISAEHGIGLERKEDLKWMKGKIALSLMHRLKQALDPENIMNPGKIIDL